MKKEKKSIKEIMSKIIDEESLRKRKEEKNKKETTIEINKKNDIEIIEDKKWWEIPMEKEKFKIKQHEKKYYAQYDGWNKKIWIGPYETRKELMCVINEYVEETKKIPLERNINNIHSILLDI